MKESILRKFTLIFSSVALYVGALVVAVHFFGPWGIFGTFLIAISLVWAVCWAKIEEIKNRTYR